MFLLLLTRLLLQLPLAMVQLQRIASTDHTNNQEVNCALHPQCSQHHLLDSLATEKMSQITGTSKAECIRGMTLCTLGNAQEEKAAIIVIVNLWLHMREEVQLHAGTFESNVSIAHNISIPFCFANTPRELQPLRFIRS